jgi:hypothetical protein
VCWRPRYPSCSVSATHSLRSPVSLRDLILQTPTLWSIVDFADSNSVERRIIYLQYSGVVSLCVRGCTTDVAPVWHRVWAADLMNIFGGLDIPSSSFRILAVQAVQDVEDVPIVKSLFDSATSLWSLGLQATFIPFTNMPPLPPLVTIELSHVKIESSQESLARILNQVPSLQNLLLEDVFFAQSWDALDEK